MAEQDKDNNQELPNVGKGAGGAARVAGLLSDERAEDVSGTLKRLLRELKGKQTLFLFALILSLTASVTQIFSPKLIGDIINYIVDGFGADKGVNWPGIGRTSGILVVLYLINFVASYYGSTSMVRIAQRVVARLRRKMNRKLNRIPLNYFDTSSSGNLQSLLSNDLDNVASTLQSGLAASITAIVMMVGVFIMMLTIHPPLAFLTLVIVPVSYFLVKFLVKKAKPIFQKNANTTGKLNGNIEEDFRGQDIISAYHLEDVLVEEMQQLNEDLYDSEWKSALVSFMTRPAGDLMLNINYVLVSVIGGYNVIAGRLSLGEFQAFIQYVRMFNGPFTMVMGILNSIMSALASAERIYKFLDEEEIKELGMEKLDPEKVGGSITLRDVDFAYVPDIPLFQNVSLQVPKGQQFAIVGTTGAGKTTLVNLLMRFYEIRGGTISLDGTDIRDYQTNELRKAFAMVLQDTWIYEGTIRENIAYGYPTGPDESLDIVPMENIEKAAQMARASHFIELLPDGYDTLLSDGGSNISQGQRQLITIVRAMIKQAPITILDEATSSVDTRTEVLIQDGMKELTEYKTSFVIAHRLSTVRHADQIIVMDKGNIVEIGTHEELLEQDGLYKKMYVAGSS